MTGQLHATPRNLRRPSTTAPFRGNVPRPQRSPDCLAGERRWKTNCKTVDPPSLPGSWPSRSENGSYLFTVAVCRSAEDELLKCPIAGSKIVPKARG
jgi:hypothetical protein